MREKREKREKKRVESTFVSTVCRARSTLLPKVHTYPEHAAAACFSTHFVLRRAPAVSGLNARGFSCIDLDRVDTQVAPSSCLDVESRLSFRDTEESSTRKES